MSHDVESLQLVRGVFPVSSGCHLMIMPGLDDDAIRNTGGQVDGTSNVLLLKNT